MRVEDIPAIRRLEAECFPSIPSDRYWKPEMLEAHIEKFPDGQWVAQTEGRIVASATNVRVNLIEALTPHRWRDITGGGYLTTHRPAGDVLYGTEVMVHPDVRRRGIARALYRLRKDYVVGQNMRAFITGGRIPDYERKAQKMSAIDYVKLVVNGKREDRTLTPQLRSGLTVAGVMPNYITDPRSQNYATLLVWWNLDYALTRSITPSQQPPPIWTTSRPTESSREN